VVIYVPSCSKYFQLSDDNLNRKIQRLYLLFTFNTLYDYVDKFVKEF